MLTSYYIWGREDFGRLHEHDLNSPYPPFKNPKGFSRVFGMEKTFLGPFWMFAIRLASSVLKLSSHTFNDSGELCSFLPND